jgi:hypothetical protein
MPRSILVRWTAATALGWALGFVLLLLLIALGGAVGLGDEQFPLGLGMAAGVGIIQARRVGEVTGGARAWVLVSTLGVTAPFLVSDIADVLRPELPYSLPVLVATGGLVTGITQWMFLRSRRRRALLWVPACGIGWLLACAGALVDYRWLGANLGMAGAVVYVAVLLGGGALLGVVQGLALRVMPEDA